MQTNAHTPLSEIRKKGKFQKSYLLKFLKRLIIECLWVILNIFIFWLIFFMLYSFATQEPKHQTISYQVSKEVSNYAEKTYGLQTFQKGVDFQKNINNLSISLGKDTNSSPEELRLIVINLSREFLKQINQNEKIRPYLSHFPFTEKDITLSIQMKNESTNSEKVIDYVYFSCGKLFYSLMTRDGTFTNLFEETYDEALSLYHTNHSDTPIANQSNPIPKVEGISKI